jgi:hypothetical protein
MLHHVLPQFFQQRVESSCIIDLRPVTASNCIKDLIETLEQSPPFFELLDDAIGVELGRFLGILDVGSRFGLYRDPSQSRRSFRHHLELINVLSGSFVRFSHIGSSCQSFRSVLQ